MQVMHFIKNYSVIHKMQLQNYEDCTFVTSVFMRICKFLRFQAFCK